MPYSAAEKTDLVNRINSMKDKLNLALTNLDSNQVYSVSLLAEATKIGVDAVAFAGRAVTTNP